MATARPKKGRDIDPATPFHQLPGDLLLSTARRLGELGFDAELAEAIRMRSAEARVCRYLRNLSVDLWPERARILGERQATEARRQRPRLIRGLYTPPERQLANVHTWNVQRHWNIPEDWFTNLGPAPTWPDGRLKCVTLEVALPDQPETKDGQGNTVPAIPGMIRTVRELWGIISHQHPKAEKWDQFHLDAKHLELLEGATYEPDLRWRVHDLGANWDKKDGIRPMDVRNPLTSPNVDGFATLAQHPEYVRSMNGTTIPFLWIPGFMVSVPGNAPRRSVPFASFYRGDRQVDLHVDRDGNRDPHYTVPVRRESKRAA